MRALVWFRRDIRLDDNGPLLAALAEADEVYACFVFEPAILDPLADRDDRRVHFIRESLAELALNWRRLGERLAAPGPVEPVFLHVDPVIGIPALAEALRVQKVYAGRDYEPAAKVRDDAVGQALARSGRALVLVKDQVVFESDEVLTGEGRPFTVFTPYSRAWKRRLATRPAHPFAAPPRGRPGVLPPALLVPGRLSVAPGEAAPGLAQIGFRPAARWPECVVPGEAAAKAALRQFLSGPVANYATDRDVPSRIGTSRLSVHLRFGTISIRQAVTAALALQGPGGETWLGELIWREFFKAVLDVRPDVVDHAFRRDLDRLQWDDAPELFAAWCEGRTGYPIVDAAQRELLATGFMHNRARMISASFLTKDLGIDWRLGERFFARHLLDYDLSSNNGGWQWCASTGCDAQPYFRIFNPVSQSQKFDSEGAYIRRWVPELAALPEKTIHAPWAAGGVPGYPAPVVDHALAREKALARFEAVRR